jgi:hypothetical protein
MKKTSNSKSILPNTTSPLTKGFAGLAEGFAVLTKGTSPLGPISKQLFEELLEEGQNKRMTAVSYQELQAWLARQKVLLKKAGFEQDTLSPNEWSTSTSTPGAVRNLILSFSRK